MTRGVSPLLLVPCLFACSGPSGASPLQAASSQDTYEYGACSTGHDDCPRDKALACALQTIASRYNACSRHEDCVPADLNARCSDAGSCPPLYVNRASKAAFEAEAQKEIDRYCGAPACRSSGLCFVTRFAARCASSRCTFESLAVSSGF